MLSIFQESGVDLAALITELMAMADGKMWVAFGGVLLLLLVELAGRIGLLNWLPEKARSPVGAVMAVLKAIGGALRKKPEPPKDPPAA